MRDDRHIPGSEWCPCDDCDPRGKLTHGQRWTDERIERANELELERLDRADRRVVVPREVA